jgi:hypothetical protein
MLLKSPNGEKNQASQSKDEEMIENSRIAYSKKTLNVKFYPNTF